MKFGTQLKISSVVVLMSVLLTSLGAGSEVRKAYALCMPQAVAEGCIVRLPRRLPVTMLTPTPSGLVDVVVKKATATPVRPRHLHDVSND